MEALEATRDLAAKVNQPLPAIIDEDLTVTAAPHGLGKYRYNLAHPAARIGLTTSRHLPAVRIQPRSDYLHGVGPATAATELTALAGRLVDQPAVSVTRLDLFADWQHWALSEEDRDRFVTGADHTRTYTHAGRLTGFDFGTRASGAMVARNYDKTVDMARRGTDWWQDVWGDRYQPVLPVQRVEFEFTRGALRQFDLTTPAETLNAIAGLWAYATDDWLTHRKPTKDRTRHRWPISPEWSQIQQAALRQTAVGIKRVRTTKRAASIRRLLPAITGDLAAFALAGTHAINDTLAALRGPLADYRRSAPPRSPNALSAAAEATSHDPAETTPTTVRRQQATLRPRRSRRAA